MLALCVEATSTTRASLMAINPATGRLAIVAAVGLPEALVGLDVTPRPRSIAEWVYRNERGLILNGEVRDQRFEGNNDADEIDSAMSLPLLSTRGPVGVLNLARRSPAPVFSEAEMKTLEAMLPPIAEAIERLRREQLGLRAVEALERLAANSSSTLLPLGAVEVRGYEMALLHRPSAGFGGDRCERVPHPNGAQSLLAIDVCGSGPKAAGVASFVQGLFVALASTERSVAGMMARLNAELCARLEEREFAALWLGQLTLKGELIYCTAGFSAPIWVPGDGSPVARLDKGGPVAGAMSTSRYVEESLRLMPGDLVVLASDGVLEARGTSDQPFGHDRLGEIAGELRRQPLERLTTAVSDAARAFSGRPVPTDDAMVLALRYNPGN
jgi:sigma-B regulation protein RsbU (phosphoserine phosphatase)